MKSLTGERKINNHSRIHKVTNNAGRILEDHKAKNKDNDCLVPEDAAADNLTVVVDGGHVHDTENKGKNFEAMIAKIYKPENVIIKDAHHTEIIEKHCTSSAKDDKQATMKRNIKEAAQKEGLTKKTTVTALADGAANCWHILESLMPYCLTVIFILDWFHIGKYIYNVKQKLPKYIDVFELVRQSLWQGDSEIALNVLAELLDKLINPADCKVVENFYEYINDNKFRIVNYEERKEKGLVFSSHVAESTVEHFLNVRAKKKQKMSWSRDGLHAVLLLSASEISGDWDEDWQNNILPELTKAA